VTDKSPAPTFRLTDKQEELRDLLVDPAVTHTLAVGGARSGKTVGMVRATFARAVKAPGSRHLIARYRFNHVINSIWHDTGPKVLSMCFPGVADRVKMDRANWYWEFPNQSQVWFGGLDDKERTEKILGTEYSTIFLNECSQIGLSARNTVITRLAQNVGLSLKAYYDENPPVQTHWTHRLFIEKREAQPPYAPLKNPEAYASIFMNPSHNAENLPPAYLAELQALPARERLRFFEGKFGDVGEVAQWTFEGIETYRVQTRPDLRRIIIGVDPSGTKGSEDGGDHIGIVVVGLGMDGHAYVLEDCSVKAPPSVWGRVVVNAFDRHAADCVVAETNFGGAMCEAVIKTAAAAAKLRVPFKEVKASRGKVVRAEPIAALYDDGKIHHCGTFQMLEDEMVSFTTNG
jgi:predicted phage terminase large subunit-like protein